MAALLVASCDRRADTGPVIVDVIGGAPALTDAARGQLSEPSRLLAGAVAQGLVRFDAAGQIEPGLAERWTVIDNGTSYFFRLRDARWSDGSAVTSTQVAAALRRQIARGSRNPLAPYLSAIAEIVEMTPQVIEVHLSRPRPDLLKLFAQPELGIVRIKPALGSGPMQLAAASAETVLLRPDVDPAQSDDDDRRPAPEDNVRLLATGPARAVARFAAHRSDLVAGGSFGDWPLVGVSGIAPANIRVDPAAGLFGLAITGREGFLADPATRAALGSAFDRPAIVAAFGPLIAADTIAPETLDSAAPPVRPAWAATPLDARRADAAARAREWQAANGAPPVIRIALPSGPGATLLWGHLAATLIAIGATPERVPLNAAAELHLVDAVAPYDSARWYLATACQPCGPEAQAALDAAREAPTMALRAQALAAADAAIAADAPFIPLARPMRWSLVALRLRQWAPNARAAHPLNHLRGGAT